MEKECICTQHQIHTYGKTAAQDLAFARGLLAAAQRPLSKTYGFQIIRIPEKEYLFSHLFLIPNSAKPLGFTERPLSGR